MVNDVGHHFRSSRICHEYMFFGKVFNSCAEFPLNCFLINESCDFFVDYGYKSFNICDLQILFLSLWLVLLILLSVSFKKQKF